MLYEVGQYAYPGLNAVGYAVAFAIVVLALTGAYATYKFWEHENS